MLRTTWLTILLSLGKEAASNINVWQLVCSKYVLRKGRSRSTLCNDVCYSKNKNKDVALCFWLTLDHNSLRDFSRKFYMGKLHPEVQPLNPFTYHFWQTRYPFLYFPLTNGASFNIPRWEIYILFFFTAINAQPVGVTYLSPAILFCFVCCFFFLANSWLRKLIHFYFY